MFNTHVGYLPTYTAPAPDPVEVPEVLDDELAALSIEERNELLAEFDVDFAAWDAQHERSWPAEVAAYQLLIEQAAIDRAEQERAEFYAAELVAA